MSESARWFYTQGVLGVMCIGLLLAVRILWIKLLEAQKENTLLRDRYEAKQESQVTQLAELVECNQELAAPLIRDRLKRTPRARTSEP